MHFPFHCAPPTQHWRDWDSFHFPTSSPEQSVNSKPTPCKKKKTANRSQRELCSSRPHYSTVGPSFALVRCESAETEILRPTHAEEASRISESSPHLTSPLSLHLRRSPDDNLSQEGQAATIGERLRLFLWLWHPHTIHDA